MWEIVRKSFDKNEVENFTNFVEDRLFKIFLKLPSYKLCIWKKMYNCESHKIQGNKLKQLQHFLSWNKANIKYSCKSQLYTHTHTHIYIYIYMFKAKVERKSN